MRQRYRATSAGGAGSKPPKKSQPLPPAAHVQIGGGLRLLPIPYLNTCISINGRWFSGSFLRHPSRSFATPLLPFPHLQSARWQEISFVPASFWLLPGYRTLWPRSSVARSAVQAGRSIEILSPSCDRKQTSTANSSRHLDEVYHPNNSAPCPQQQDRLRPGRTLSRWSRALRYRARLSTAIVLSPSPSTTRTRRFVTLDVHSVSLLLSAAALPASDRIDGPSVPLYSSAPLTGVAANGRRTGIRHQRRARRRGAGHPDNQGGSGGEWAQTQPRGGRRRRGGCWSEELGSLYVVVGLRRGGCTGPQDQKRGQMS